MKKIKTVLMTLFICALGYGSYTAYDYITMSDAERFLLANIEALTQNEENGLKECPSTTTISGDKIVYSHAKNRWLGLVAGCKYDCRFTCTVKDFAWPDFN